MRVQPLFLANRRRQDPAEEERARTGLGRPAPPGVIRSLGLGLITGAADDDPSAIGTYASAGAKFGPALLWTAPVTLPMMFAVVYLSSKLGQVCGEGLFAVVRRRYPPWILHVLLGGALVGNVIEAGADLGGMAAAARRPGGCLRPPHPGAPNVGTLHPDPRHVPVAGAGAAGLCGLGAACASATLAGVARHAGPPAALQSRRSDHPRGHYRHQLVGLPL